MMIFSFLKIIIFTIDFSTTYVLKETNEVVTNPILIAKHFVIDSWRRFGADILGALPWDILFFGNGSHSVIEFIFERIKQIYYSFIFFFYFKHKTDRTSCQLFQISSTFTTRCICSKFSKNRISISSFISFYASLCHCCTLVCLYISFYCNS
jgi:hypothetical protein